jgi:uncharacterized protein
MKNNINALLIALAVIISATILASAWKKSHQSHNSINVTGLASKDFSSDLIVWTGSFQRKAMTTPEAFSMLKQDMETIKKYLISKGIVEKEIVFSAVNINKEFEHIRDKNESETDVFTGYNLTQRIEIESKNVEKIEQVSREVTELIDKGIEFYSDAPRYYYTKLADLKIEMLAAATKDARTRAEKIAENAGGGIDKLMFADMGIFQITGQNSIEDYSWGGTFNTTSKNKTASITVKLEFAID